MKVKSMSKGKEYMRRYILGLLAVIIAAALVPSGAVMAAQEDAGISMQTDQESGEDKKDEDKKEEDTKDDKGKDEDKKDDSKADNKEKTKKEEFGIEEHELKLSSKNKEVPVFKEGKKRKWVFTLTNNSDIELKDVSVKPDLGETEDTWPFETNRQDYEKTVKKLSPRQTVDITFMFTQRENMETKRQTLQFVVMIGGKEFKTQKVYAKTTGDTDVGEPGDDGGDDIPDDGGFTNGDVSSDDGEGSESSSVPRVIVTGFATNPPEVQAGKDFTLIVHLQNTSKTTAVKNMLFEMNAPTEGDDEQTASPAFLPSSGSSTVYLDGIGAGGSADIAMKLNAKSDLMQKPYSIELSMRYEDAGGTGVETSSNLSIPVKQKPRFEFSTFEVNPTSISVGDEANVMFSLYNLGRTKLYNVKAKFAGPHIDSEEVFVGNVDSGATASIDTMLTGIEVSEGPETVTMTLSYEDETGKVSEKKEELELEVAEMMEGDMMMGDMGEEIVESKSKLPLIIGLIVVIVVIAAVVIIVKRNKKRRMKNEEEALLDELDGPSEDEWE